MASTAANRRLLWPDVELTLETFKNRLGISKNGFANKLARLSRVVTPEVSQRASCLAEQIEERAHIPFLSARYTRDLRRSTAIYWIADPRAKAPKLRTYLEQKGCQTPLLMYTMRPLDLARQLDIERVKRTQIFDRRKRESKYLRCGGLLQHSLKQMLQSVIFPFVEQLEHTVRRLNG